MNRNYDKELSALASAIYNWADAVSKQNWNGEDMRKCLYEFKTRCSQANNIALLCEASVIKEIKQKGKTK